MDAEKHYAAILDLLTLERFVWANSQEEMTTLLAGGSIALAWATMQDYDKAALVLNGVLTAAYYLGYQKAKSEGELESLWGEE